MNILYIILISLNVCFIATVVNSVEWITYSEVPKGTVHSYNRDDIVFDGHTVKVWTRFDYVSPEAKERELNGRRKQGLATEGFENISYDLNLWEVDCQLKRFGLLRYRTYDDKGMILESGSAEQMGEEEWEDVAPNSKSEDLYKIVCNMAKKKSPPETAPKGKEL